MSAAIEADLKAVEMGKLTMEELAEIQQLRLRNEYGIEEEEMAQGQAMRDFGRFGIVRRRPARRKPLARPVNSPGVPMALRRAS